MPEKVRTLGLCPIRRDSVCYDFRVQTPDLNGLSFTSLFNFLGADHIVDAIDAETTYCFIALALTTSRVSPPSASLL